MERYDEKVYYCIWMFTVKLQQYTNLDNSANYLQAIDTDYQGLLNQNNDSLVYALKINKIIQSDNHINDIISNQSKTIEQVNQTKNLLKIWINTSNNSVILSNFKISILNSLQMAQQNITNTNQFKHQLILEETKNDETPTK